MFGKCLEKINRLLRQGILLSLRGYQYWVSPNLGQHCRFHPSCSQYAVEAMTHCPFFKGLWLIVKRIIRCHPFHPGGYDPLLVNEQRLSK